MNNINVNAIQKILTQEEEIKLTNKNSSKEIPLDGKILSVSKSKTINNLKTTVDITNRHHSAETSFIQVILKEFIKNMKKSRLNGKRI